MTNQDARVSTSQNPPLRMGAYYFAFEPTGVAEIDRILSAVAVAGAGSHHTQDWEELGFIAHIQNAANQAAAEAWNRRASSEAGAGAESPGLLRCPLCGELAGFQDWRPDIALVGVYVRCTVCGCTGPKMRNDQGDARELAARAWNRRATSEAGAGADDIEQRLAEMTDEEWVGIVCDAKTPDIGKAAFIALYRILAHVTAGRPASEQEADPARQLFVCRCGRHYQITDAGAVPNKPRKMVNQRGAIHYECPDCRGDGCEPVDATHLPSEQVTADE